MIWKMNNARMVDARWRMTAWWLTAVCCILLYATGRCERRVAAAEARAKDQIDAILAAGDTADAVLRAPVVINYYRIGDSNVAKVLKVRKS